MFDLLLLAIIATLIVGITSEMRPAMVRKTPAYYWQRVREWR